MKATIRNIGVLKHAEVDLAKDLIILTGPNNSGKTYAAYTTYAIFRNAFSEREFPLSSFETQIDSSAIDILLKDGTTSIDIWELFVGNENRFSHDFINEVANSLHNVFDTPRDFFNKASISLSFEHSATKHHFKSVSLESTLKFGEYTIRFQKNTGDFKLDISVLQEQTKGSKAQRLLIVKDLIPRFLTDFIVKALFQRTYFSPAERIAINLFSRQLSVQRNRLVDNLLSYKDGNETNSILSRTKLYPLPIRDALEIAERLVEYQKENSEYGYISDWIEQEILKGKVKLSKEGEVQYKPDGYKIKPLGIHLSASMVKSLASLVFYFRHIAKRGDFIIIDEPELNLHPDNQRKVAKLLARIVNAGFKVMISTHSDYVYRELNNLIMLNRDGENSKEVATKFGYQKEDLLDYKRITAYLFMDNESIQLPVTETGFEIKTIDDEIGRLNEISMEIFTSI